LAETFFDVKITDVSHMIKYATWLTIVGIHPMSFRAPTIINAKHLKSICQ